MRIVIKGDTIESLELNKMNSGAIQYYEAELEFDEEWNGLEKKAIIVSRNEDYAKEIAILDNKMYFDIEERNDYCIGFVGYQIEDEKKIKQISTNLRMLLVHKGAGQIKTSEHNVPTPTEWELYIQQIKEICSDLHAENVKFVDGETFQEKYDSGKLNGKDGKTPVKGVDYFTSVEQNKFKKDIEEELKPILNETLEQAKDYTDNTIVKDFKDISYNSDTCTFIFTRHDNTTFTVDLPLENTVKDGRYDADTEELVLILISGQEIRIPVSGLIDDYTGIDSATIQISITSDNKITCNIKAGSITKTLLSEELQSELNNKVGTEVFNQELNKKLDKASFIELTQAEYDALETKDPNLYYFIIEED